ncbi:MAG: carbohydrate ABC transporter permease [Lachnospiraceae bacterium]|nr:carbohydrate ABC transporter permease [Lachnospiraceae bacterium]
MQDLRTKSRIRKWIGTGLIYLLMAVFLIITVYPIIWMLAGALKGENEFYSNIWGLPSSPQWENYAAAWKKAGMGRKYLNSILTTAGTLCLLIPVNCCAAYALARVNFRGKRAILNYLLLGIMMPAGVLAMPVFTVVNELGLINTRIGLTLVYTAQSIAFGMYIMRGFFISLPKSLEEAAMIDGCTRFQSFLHIILPLAVPGLVTQVIFSGLSVWNEYIRASLIIRTPELQTLPLGMVAFSTLENNNYPQMFAALSMATLPMVLVYLLCQKAFQKGVTAGAVKG